VLRMATGNSFKEIDNGVTNSTLLHEHIPITGSIWSGSYVKISTGEDVNVQRFDHEMFESVWDYPLLSSSANLICNIVPAYSTQSPHSNSANTQNTKRINLHNMFAQTLEGFDSTGSIKRFDLYGEDVTTGTKMNEMFFFVFSRLLVKDEIKKGTFKIEFGVGQEFQQKGTDGSVVSKTFNKRILIQDYSGSTGYWSRPGGEVGQVYAQTSFDGEDDGTLRQPLLVGEEFESNASKVATRPPVGLIYYQAGIIAITGSVFGSKNDDGKSGVGQGIMTGSTACELALDISGSGFDAITGSTQNTICKGIRNRIYNCEFSNTTELQSKIYFCRVNHNDFNYTSNPTNVTGGMIANKNNEKDTSTTFITGVGLYNAANELLAVAKVSEPLVNTPADEFTIRVRLDY